MSNSMKPMRVVRGICQSVCVVLLLLACGALSAQNQEHRVRNIVLVHGAWADGSGWKGVYDIVVKDGYNVSIVQEPETSFKEDVAATKRVPSDLAKSGAIMKTPDGFTYVDPAQFHELFAADLPADQAALMARSQVLNFADNFSATITTAAWRTKPSWMLVAGSDRTINPELERWYAKRAKSHTVEVAGASHAVYVSHPKEVADLIESAARAVSK